MRRLLLLLAALALCGGSPASAWDPDAADADTEAAPPMHEPAPEAAPALETAAAPDPVSSGPSVAQQALELGLVQVTIVRVADVVTQQGDLTILQTTVRPEEPPRFSRPLAAVAAGESTGVDAAIEGQRLIRPDGRPAAGEVWAQYMEQDGQIVLEGYYFFNDDSELARRPAPAEQPAPQLDATDTRMWFLPVDLRDSAVSPDGPVDIVERPLGQSETSGTDAPAFVVAAPLAPPGTVPTAPPVVAPWPVVVGVDPLDGAEVRTSLEVARGQRFALRVNARTDGGPAAVEAWTLVGGTNDAANPAGWQPGDAPLIGQWLRLPVPGGAWTLALRVRARLADARVVDADGRVDVFVRAPALIE